MPIESNYELLQALLRATKPTEVYTILSEIGDSDELELDELFGKEHYQWHCFGDRETNISAIGYGSKPGRSLIERVTNGIDAMLEKRMVQGGQPPSSPMEAAGKWFGQPASTNDSGHFWWEEVQIATG